MSQPFYRLAPGDQVDHEIRPGPGAGIDLINKLGNDQYGTDALAGRFPVLTIQCLEKQSLPDFFNSGSKTVVSDRFRSLCDGFRVNAEFLPVNIVRPDGAPASDLPYWFLHPLERIDCIDQDASVYDIYGEKKDRFVFAGFKRLVMRPEVIGDRDLFRPQRYPFLYVSQKLRDAIERAGLVVDFDDLEGTRAEPVIADVRAQETDVRAQETDVRVQETIVADVYK